MITPLYSVFDKLSKAFAPVFPAKNDAVALRYIEISFKNSPQLNKNDFVLKYVGKFNEETGELISDTVRDVFSDKEEEDLL